jgi:beta-glucosidase-like glycosyl hydrolase/CubicO group peptidase (beta-lactamase class C family)
MNRVVKFGLLVILVVGVESSAFSQNISFSKVDSTWADSVMQQMTLREKIGQLFMLDIHPDYSHLKRKQEIMDAIAQYNLGGAIFMKGEYQVGVDWIQEFQRMSKVPMMMSIDGEWGMSMRIKNALKYPYQLTLGAIQDNNLIFQMGKNIGKECRSMGLQVNFAPDVDVNVNPRNPVINYRSFGENKYNVTAKAEKYALGMQSEGVMANLKHFPGHGDTDKDSHKDLPTINKPKNVLEDLELYPFRELIKKNIWSAMVGHLNVPALDSSGRAASLSWEISTNLLKNKLGFNGLVFSDALNMKGAKTKFEPGDIEFEAYKAGMDILVFSENMPIALTKIEEYISMSEENFVDFHDRIYKILLFKSKLIANSSFSFQPNFSYINTPSNHEHFQFCQKLYDHSLTYISEDKDFVKRLQNPTSKNLLITVGSSTDNYLRNWAMNMPNYQVVSLSKNADINEIFKIYDALNGFDNVVVAYNDLSQHANKNFGLNVSMTNFISQINSFPNVLNIWMGNPYGLIYFQNAKNVLVAYEDNVFTHTSIYNFLNNRWNPIGKLPVSVGKFKEGNKIDEKQKITTFEVISEEELTSSPLTKEEIEKVDFFCDDMIANGATPGCQVVVYHKGKEILNKAYGSHTYALDAKKVSKDDVYDLASLTKILSTTLAIMRLKDLGHIRIYGQVKDYLELDSSATIKDVFISQLMTHSAGFTPFIPFYQRFNNDNYFQYFSMANEGKFNVKVTENLYVREDFKDSMWYEMSHSKLSGIGKYKYSDLSMYTMQKIIESISKTPLEKFVYESFFKPMNLKLTFNPYKSISLQNIVPTEYDVQFRKQLVHGYVHDQGAALYGGVAGHAGLFGRAKDVAEIMQMLMNYGSWNGKKFFNELTVKQFTSQQNENSRRGLGFDKPEKEGPTSSLCSSNTFGHTGFTGTCAWADPDHELVFVFLSNRIYPDAENKKLISGNYRAKLQTLIYNLIGVK